MQYEITEYTIGIINKLKKGWILKYDSSEQFGTAYITFGKESESISNWVLTVLLGNNFLICDKKYPISTYKLNDNGKRFNLSDH